MVQQLLRPESFKRIWIRDPYSSAPAWANIFGIAIVFMELPLLAERDTHRVGLLGLSANALVTRLLNVLFVRSRAYRRICKTSAVVMILSVVLKDIVLVAVASILIFHDPITRLQYCAYSIALAGPVTYERLALVHIL